MTSDRTYIRARPPDLRSTDVVSVRLSQSGVDWRGVVTGNVRRSDDDMLSLDKKALGYREKLHKASLHNYYSENVVARNTSEKLLDCLCTNIT